MNCRHCGNSLQHTVLDLGFAPPSNAYLSAADLCAPELHYPLRLKVCERCWLVQTEDYARAEELFAADYAYFSSTSTSWLEHAARYAERITRRLALDGNSFVIEVASNDGYLLRNFVACGIPCLGIEPTRRTAEAAEKLGIPVRREFFGAALARRLAEAGQQADLIVGNNVYAHVPDINDFTCGLATALKPGGTVTLEFPHLLRLIERNQFDTVYHEHYSYLSLHTVGRIFAAAGLRVCDVEELSTHGGSLRVYGCHGDDPRADSDAVAAVVVAEERCGLRTLAGYRHCQEQAERVKDDLLRFLLAEKGAGRRVAGYGAAAKGNTLLNFAGVTPDLLPFVCDAAPSKQGKFLPGSHIPILPPEALRDARPPVILLLPWNLRAEISEQLSYARAWKAQFATCIPRLEVF